MQNQAYTKEDDIDLIIANLFRDDRPMRTNRNERVAKSSSEILDKNIEYRVLPISMRKRLMYSMMVHV